MSNTFALEFINLNCISSQPRKYTTCAQLFSQSIVGVKYEPSFMITLSSDGADWEAILENLKSTLSNASFYRDAPEILVEFAIAFDFRFAMVSDQQKSDFIDKAKLVLNGDRANMDRIVIEENLLRLQQKLEADYLQHGDLYVEELKEIRADIEETKQRLLDLENYT